MAGKSKFGKMDVVALIVIAVAIGYGGLRWHSAQDDNHSVETSSGRHAQGEGRRDSGKAEDRESYRIRQRDALKREAAEERAEEARAARQQRLEDREDSDLIDEIAEMIRQELSEPEREYLRQLREALASNDNKRILSVARLALKSGNKQIKESTIDALGWVGEDALPELTEFLMDDDEEIVQAAIDKWEEAIRECENEADIIENTMLGMMAIKDEAACDYLSMNLIKSGEATLAVEAIMQLVQCDNTACHTPAKEAYEWVTNNEWTNLEDAQAWIDAHPDL